MIRKYADCRDVTRLTDKHVSFTYLNNSSFKGYISLIHIKKVEEPIVVNVAGKERCLAGDGYYWIRHFPDNYNYNLLTMFNSRKEVIQWYFDICTGNKIDEAGIPYFDDIYLDISVLNTGEIILLDEDELEEALVSNDITKAEYKLAINTAQSLYDDLLNNRVNLIRKSYEYLDYMLDCYGAKPCAKRGNTR